MDRDAVIQTLKSNQAELRLRGVEHTAVFGSIARGEATQASDIDLLIDIDPAANVGVFEYVGIIQFLASLFPVNVDVANRAQLKALVRPSAERDAVYAF
jgi:predicted nucleotidyltransferase